MNAIIETESALVGACLLDPSQIDIVAGIVAPTDFHDTELRSVFDLITDMHGAGEPVTDTVLVSRRLREAGLLDRIGGNAGLAKLALSAGSAHHARVYATEIKTDSSRRRLQSVGREIVKRCTDQSDPVEIAAWIDSQIRGCLASDSASRSITIADAAHEVFDAIELAKTQEQSIGVPTGFWSVDEALGGMFPGELAIIAARPSIGKSAMAAQIAMHNAEHKRPVLFVSLEMTSRDIALRAIAGELGIDSRDLRSGRVNAAETAAAIAYAGSLVGVPFFLWTVRSATVAKIRSAARVQLATTGLSLIVVDYLGLVHATDRRKPRWEQITEVSNDLKSLALELNIPVLALCQLNREAEKIPPRLDHLRDAGAIEQDADIVMLLHRESRDSAMADLNVAKARNAVTGSLSLGFDGDRVRFTDAAEWRP